MCDALMELMRDELKDEFDKIRADARTAGETIGLKEGLAAGRREGLSIGRREGLETGRREGLETGRREGLETGRREGLETGRREGQIQGIRALIETCQDLNASKENTVSQLVVRYSLEQKAARECVEKYWK